jgi:hypothetical protein
MLRIISITYIYCSLDNIDIPKVLKIQLNCKYLLLISKWRGAAVINLVLQWVSVLFYVFAEF